MSFPDFWVCAYIEIGFIDRPAFQREVSTCLVFQYHSSWLYGSYEAGTRNLATRKWTRTHSQIEVFTNKLSSRIPNSLTFHRTNEGSR